MDRTVIAALKSVEKGGISFCKFLSGNDTGMTGSHQCGIYISKPSISILFDIPGTKGMNKDKWVDITWNSEFKTKSRFIYYGTGTRNEYRITHFGRGFSLIKPSHIGSLFILSKVNENRYQAFVLDLESQIDQFLSVLGLSSADTNKLILLNQPLFSNEFYYSEITKYLQSVEDLPPINAVCSEARNIFSRASAENVIKQSNADDKIVEYVKIEYQIFRSIEQKIYGSILDKGSISKEFYGQAMTNLAKTRTGRASDSLTEHLLALLEPYCQSNIKLSEQKGVQKLDLQNNIDLIIKPTCVSDWSKGLTPTSKRSYLFTMQQGMPPARIEEIFAGGFTLIVPEPYIPTYPSQYRQKILTLEQFLHLLS